MMFSSISAQSPLAFLFFYCIISYPLILVSAVFLWESAPVIFISGFEVKGGDTSWLVLFAGYSPGSFLSFLVRVLFNSFLSRRYRDAIVFGGPRDVPCVIYSGVSSAPATPFWFCLPTALYLTILVVGLSLLC
ncbi:hypothetical protein BJ508DRAFT_57390 [Ascobolus immersus RN42]|uniref:Uncharacterized protein n=1 Tax=Ascobolus immersus RN42 TaxID=1160509 RepID=A0A3N4IE35_ASCIM|nr:hypothetical protein BJ508DRAFT_57390 [Ascobolus immersus RN42]